MFSPLLIIGVGGSGGKTIRAMKDSLDRQLKLRDVDSIPDAWQFLQFDTTRDGIDFPPPMLPKDEVHLVVSPGESFQDVRQKLDSLGPLEARQRMLAGWGIPVSPIAIEKGAGQQRGIGRQVGVADARAIIAALTTAINKMNAPTAMSQLTLLAKKLGSDEVEQTPNALIIASLAGGSGAGMFIDIAEFLKRATTDKWATEAMSILYTSEVFDGLGDAGSDVRKNSLGAMNEVIAGKWNGLSDRTLDLYSRLGIPNSAVSNNSQFGCKGNILVGARNSSGANLASEATGSGMDEVFLTVGESLAGVFTDPTISEFLYKQAFVNITQRKMTVDNSGLAPEVSGSDTLTFAGIGFGKITLGTNRVIDYVADAMTKTQVEKLLWPELNNELKTEGVNTKVLVESKSNELWLKFLNSSGLDERDTNNQVLDLLMPQNYQTNLTSFVRKVVLEGFSDKPKPLNLVAKGVWSGWESGINESLESQALATKHLAVDWRKMIQDKVVDLVAETTTQHGFNVAIHLLGRLEEEVSDYGAKSLRREYTDSRNEAEAFTAARWMEQFTAHASGMDGLSTLNSDVMKKSEGTLQRIYHRRYESHVKKVAESLLLDFSKNFLVPLRESLVRAKYNLNRDWESELLESDLRNPKKDFPDWGTSNVGAKYRPRTIERTLIRPEGYESLFNKYAGRDAGEPEPYSKAVGHSLLGIKLDVPPGEKTSQKFIVIEPHWIPSVSEAQQTGEGEIQAQFEVKSGLIQRMVENRKWLNDPKSSFGELKEMSIREFVGADGDPAQQTEREDRFVESFQAMLKLAEPLVKLNQNAMRHVISVSSAEPASGVMRKTSKIPFAANSRVGKRCVDILKQMGVAINEEGFEGKWFDSASSSSTMFAASTTQASLPAWAFESLTKPIAEQVAIAKTNPGIWNTQFWDGRRGRPLTESVPFSQEIRRSIVTGWFIARLLGMVDVQTVPAGRQVNLWNPNLQTPGWSRFPDPLLPSTAIDNSKEWLLPGLLMSAGIAFVELGQSGALEAVHPYQLLKFLGREVTTTIPSRDVWDGKGNGDYLPNQKAAKCQILVDWINRGEHPNPNSSPISSLLTSGDSPEARRLAFIQIVEKIQAEYADAWLLWESKEWHELPQTWELKDDIDRAFHDIRTYLVGLNASTVGSTTV